MPIPAAMLKLCLPAVLGLLMIVIYNMADTFFVGLLGQPAQTAAVAVAAPVLLAFNSISNLFGFGTSSVMSRALGKKDYDTIRQSSAFGFYCAAAGALLISLGYLIFNAPLMDILGATEATLAPSRDYMFWTVMLGALPSILNMVLSNMVRAEGYSLHASVGTMSGCLLNILLDPLFILPWGLNMGAAGAGFATFISNCFACLYYFVLLRLRRGNTYISLNPARLLKVKKEVPLAVFGVGIPAMIQNLLNVTGMTLLHNFAADFGPEALSAVGIAGKVASMAMYIGLGIGQGIMPLVGYNYSSGNVKRMKEAIITSGKVTLLVMTTISAIFILFPGQTIAFFMKNDQVIAYGSMLIIGYALAQPFMGIDFLGVGVFQACGMGKSALIFALMRKIVLEIPLLFILNHFFPLYGLPYAQVIAEIILATLAIIMLIRLVRKLSLKQKNEASASA
ncbi:MAG: MATE family efflux transporter [Clostridia bacterium]|nr:MATE family efflux transporter [Clostridia bacterium]